MPERVDRKIQLRAKSCTPTVATMSVDIFSQKEQKIRAVKALLLLWLIALVSALIPMAHFILVPGFFIAGVVIASRRWRTAEEGLEATGVCPSCDHQIVLDLEKNSDLPQWSHCPDCTIGLELGVAS
ncbi:MAG TPA: hypothetical protein ENI62_06615 [Gammaproteobacteria bacterium]|nr:hypothetical protein [Gammaproteobacteria bacterium]